jgi:hypothetical protein
MMQAGGIRYPLRYMRVMETSTGPLSNSRTSRRLEMMVSKQTTKVNFGYMQKFLISSYYYTGVYL